MFDHSLHFPSLNDIDTENIRRMAASGKPQHTVYPEALEIANEYDALLNDAMPLHERMEDDSQRVVEVMEETGNVDEAEDALGNITRAQREYDGIQGRADKITKRVDTMENTLTEMIESAPSTSEKDDLSGVLHELDWIREEVERFHENAATIDNWLDQ